ncbi:hypothetical protein ABW19_dt0205696 [Dactylella cylindrospora]|nr:hypothetical protein ABW19_dt0205696 [Dactylella cylindrospora]
MKEFASLAALEARKNRWERRLQGWDRYELSEADFEVTDDFYHSDSEESEASFLRNLELDEADGKESPGLLRRPTRGDVIRRYLLSRPLSPPTPLIDSIAPNLMATLRQHLHQPFSEETLDKNWEAAFKTPIRNRPPKKFVFGGWNTISMDDFLASTSIAEDTTVTGGSASEKPSYSISPEELQDVASGEIPATLKALFEKYPLACTTPGGCDDPVKSAIVEHIGETVERPHPWFHPAIPYPEDAPAFRERYDPTTWELASPVPEGDPKYDAIGRYIGPNAPKFHRMTREAQGRTTPAVPMTPFLSSACI